jgi:hypothetical protein
METLIQQKGEYFNPYFFNGNQVQNIYFFDSEGIKANTNWFSNNGSNNDFKEFIIPSEIKRKLKVNFYLKHAFVVTTKKRHFEGYNLYIPIDLFNYEIKRDIKRFSTNLYDSYCDLLSIEIKSNERRHKLDENNNLEYYYNGLELNNINIKFNFKDIDTKHGKKCKKLAKEFSVNHNNISKYDIDRILQNYNISKKRVKTI